MDLNSRDSKASSTESVVEKRFGLITTNTEILAFMVCGVITTMVEMAGYWPRMRLAQLFPDATELDVQDEFIKWIFQISEGVEIVRFYSTHVYLATYILLPYTVLTETQKVLLTPWLLCGVLRSIFLNLLTTLAGILLCSYNLQFHYPCFQYSLFHAAEFCVSLFVWTTVHTFYHYLDKRTSDYGISKIIKTIYKAGVRKKDEYLPVDSPNLSLTHSEEDEDILRGSDTSLVERAAMAWIAREILDSGAEYVSESEFSHYLNIKATMELRQILKELADKKSFHNTKRDSSRQRKVHERLERAVTRARRSPSSKDLPNTEQQGGLSRRDPIRKIPPLTYLANPCSDVCVDPSQNTLGKTLPSSTAVSEHSCQSQTDPLSPELARLMDAIERQQRSEPTKVSTTEDQQSSKDIKGHDLIDRRNDKGEKEEYVND